PRSALLGTPLFPYTTLFRSEVCVHRDENLAARCVNPCGHRCCLPVVAPQGDDAHARVARGDLAQRFETAVRRAVVHVDYLGGATDRKSTRLNSSHSQISYAV